MFLSKIFLLDFYKWMIFFNYKFNLLIKEMLMFLKSPYFDCLRVNNKSKEELYFQRTYPIIS